ncbi:hypothetical protein BDR26DRAFT_893704 [Obelidium mucronatum]|nr:hypothetical protein BDR26DRAFT_893704 [Obelidium mucronatum]
MDQTGSRNSVVQQQASSTSRQSVTQQHHHQQQTSPLDQVTFEECLRQLNMFDSQLQTQQQHLKGLQVNLAKYIERVKPGTVITSDQTAAFLQMNKMSRMESNTSIFYGAGGGGGGATSGFRTSVAGQRLGANDVFGKLSTLSIADTIETAAKKYREKRERDVAASRNSLGSQGWFFVFFFFKQRVADYSDDSIASAENLETKSIKPPTKTKGFDTSSKFSDKDKRRRSSIIAAIIGEPDNIIELKSIILVLALRSLFFCADHSSQLFWE